MQSTKSLTQNDEIVLKKEIQNLLDRGKGDYETLLAQISDRKRLVEVNLPQYVAARSTSRPLTKQELEKGRYCFLEWGRGTGKTTMLGYFLSEIVQNLPRSTGLLIGPSYQFILTRIIPSLVQGLEMFGMYRNIHYFIGERPPRAWRRTWGKAYQEPKKYDKYITFFNGVGIHLISHDVAGDGRGINSDWIIGDEAALLDPSKLQENTDPTLRGTRADIFTGRPFFGWRIYTSSTPITPEGRWMLNYEQKALEDPGIYTYMRATCRHNLYNLRPGYLDEAKKNAYKLWVYDAEYEGIRPRFTKDSFYPLFDPNVHCYTNYDYNHYQKVGSPVDCRGDADLVKGQALILGVDWGAAINCLTISQHLLSINEYRTLKSMFVLGDNQEIQDDLFLQFHEYYQFHDRKEIYLWYDNTGNLNTGHTRQTRAEQARKQLTALGWKVSLMTMGMVNPQHELKHVLWNMILKEDHPRLPRYRVNREQCKELRASMANAKALTGRDGSIKKDKSSEKNSGIPRQEATDLSDANDSPIFGLFHSFLYNTGGFLPDTKVSSRK